MKKRRESKKWKYDPRTFFLKQVLKQTIIISADTEQLPKCLIERSPCFVLSIMKCDNIAYSRLCLCLSQYEGQGQ